MNYRTLAIAWNGLNVLLGVVAISLIVLTLDVPWVAWGVRGGGVVSMLIVVVVGAVLTMRRPRNAVGWLIVAATTHLMLDDVGTYSRMWVGARELELPLALAALFEAAWVPGMVLFLYAMARFPDGEAPTGRRGRLIHVLGPLALVSVSAAMIASEVGAEPPPVLFLPFPAYAVTVLTAVVARFRRSSGIHRQQFRWFAYGAVPFVLGFVMLPLVVAQDEGIATVAQALLNLVGITVMVAAIAVAILRYRLYDLDRILSRTATYVALTAVLLGVYASAVLVFGSIARASTGGDSSAVVVALSTLVAAALFDPLRRRLQATIDRRLNRRRYDARSEVERLGARLTDEVDRIAVERHVVDVIGRTVQPARVGIWAPTGNTSVTASTYTGD